MSIKAKTMMNRVEKVRSSMRDRNLDAVVVYSAPTHGGPSTTTAANVRYLTGWAHSIRPSLFVLPIEGEPVLLVIEPSDAQAATEMENNWVQDVRATVVTALGTAAQEILQGRGVSRVGVIGQTEMTVPVYLGLTSQSSWEFEAADDLLAQRRVIKEPEEIELHRKAAGVSDSMLYAAMTAARVPATHGWQVMAEMKNTGISLNANQVSCWVSSGAAPNAWTFEQRDLMDELHDNDRVDAGTFVTYEGYWGHGIRMGIKGKPSSDLKRYFEAAVAVQDVGMRELRPGNSFVNVADAMDRAIDEVSPIPRTEDKLRFRMGHALGLSYNDPIVSDAFSLSPSRRQSTATVQPGMVIELHPNFLIPKLGRMRVGDMILVTGSGTERLTNCSRELFEI